LGGCIDWRDAVKVHYLEIVAPDVAGVCQAYQSTTGAEFSQPDPVLGNARVADLPDGAMIGVRAPMSESEAPAIRP
jgi:hypothetical protein